MDLDTFFKRFPVQYCFLVSCIVSTVARPVTKRSTTVVLDTVLPEALQMGSVCVRVIRFGFLDQLQNLLRVYVTRQNWSQWCTVCLATTQNHNRAAPDVCTNLRANYSYARRLL